MWHPQVHKRNAIEDGLSEQDFEFEHWKPSNIKIRLPEIQDQLPKVIGLVFQCDIPKDTPQCNRYVLDNSDPTGYRQLPDPIGMCLSSIKLELRDSKTGKILDTDLRDHENGKVLGMVGPKSGLWKIFVPGISLDVKLFVSTKFMYLAKDGAMRGDFASTSDGYFHGQEVESEEFKLAMDQDGNISVSGSEAKQSVANKHIEEKETKQKPSKQEVMMAANAIRGGKSYNTESADKIFERPFKMGGAFPFVGRVYKTAKNASFMTAYPESFEEQERFLSNKTEDIFEFLDEVEAPAEVYEKLGIDLEEA